MAFISFLDLLGTKNLSVTNAKEYSDSIFKFKSALTDIATEDEELTIYYFSDCAYIQSKDIKKLLKQLETLRNKLLDEEICFTAAICEGDLDPEENWNGTNVKGVLFKGAAISRVYLKQTQLQGIGISIDSKIMERYQKSKWISNNIINNYFISNRGKDLELQTFFDVLFMPKRNHFSKDDLYIYNQYCHFCLRRSIKEGIRSRRVGRYYFSPLINLLASVKFTIENIECKENKELIKKEEFNLTALFGNNINEEYKIYDYFIYYIGITKEVSCKIVGIEYILLYLINKLYQDNLQNSSYTNSMLKRLISSGFIDKYLNDLSLVPNVLFDETTWPLFLNDYYNIIENI